MLLFGVQMNNSEYPTAPIFSLRPPAMLANFYIISLEKTVRAIFINNLNALFYVFYKFGGLLKSRCWTKYDCHLFLLAKLAIYELPILYHLLIKMQASSLCYPAG